MLKAADFGTRVKQLLAGLGITQQELAWLLGISHVTVSRWTTGEMTPSRLTDMVIGTLELVLRKDRGPELVRAIRKRTFKGGTPEALKLISDLSTSRRGR